MVARESAALRPFVFGNGKGNGPMATTEWGIDAQEVPIGHANVPAVTPPTLADPSSCLPGLRRGWGSTLVRGDGDGAGNAGVRGPRVLLGRAVQRLLCPLSPERAERATKCPPGRPGTLHHLRSIFGYRLTPPILSSELALELPSIVRAWLRACRSVCNGSAAGRTNGGRPAATSRPTQHPPAHPIVVGNIGSYPFCFATIRMRGWRSAQTTSPAGAFHLPHPPLHAWGKRC